MRPVVIAAVLCLALGCEPLVSVRITGPDGINTLKVEVLLDGESARSIEVERNAWDWFGLRLPDDAPGRSLVVKATAEIDGCVQAGGRSEAVEVPHLGWRQVEVEVAVQERGDVGIVYKGDGVGTVAQMMEQAGARLVASANGDNYFAGWRGCPSEAADGSCLVRAGRGCVTALFGKRGQTPSGWWWENPLPQGNTLYGVWGLGERDIWAVGGHGAIVHFDGDVWSSRPSPVKATLRAVHGSAGQGVWAVGDEGTVLRLVDGKWVQLMNLMDSVAFHSVHVTKSGVYVAGAGGVILASKDQGGSWQTLCEKATTKDLRAVCVLESGALFAAGQDVVLKRDEKGVCTSQSITGDINAIWGSYGAGTGGQIWDLVSGKTDESAGSVALHGLSGQQDGTLLAVGAGGRRFLRQGRWTLESGPDGTEDFDLQAAWLGPDGRAWAVGEGGLILSRSAGVWKTAGRRAVLGLNELRGLGALGKDLWTVGRREGPGGGMVLQRLAGQGAWTLDFLDKSKDGDLYGFSASPSGTLWAVGKAGRVLRRRPGQPWEAFVMDGKPLLYGVWSTDTEAWLVGVHNKTLRFGASATAPDAMLLNDVNHLHAVVGRGAEVWAVGTPDRVLRSSMGMWVEEMVPKRSALLDAASISQGGDVWAAAGNCVLQRSAALMGTWSAPHCPNYALYAITVDQAQVWAGGDKGRVGRWDGMKWTSRDIGTESTIKGLLINEGALFAVGSRDAILRLVFVAQGQ